jgi:hypothetical protein
MNGTVSTTSEPDCCERPAGTVETACQGEPGGQARPAAELDAGPGEPGTAAALARSRTAVG